MQLIKIKKAHVQPQQTWYISTRTQNNVKCIRRSPPTEPVKSPAQQNNANMCQARGESATFYLASFGYTTYIQNWRRYAYVYLDSTVAHCASSRSYTPATHPTAHVAIAWATANEQYNCTLKQGHNFQYPYYSILIIPYTTIQRDPEPRKYER